MFIVFEGTDGSGTSTQAKLLTERLKKKGLSVLHTREPSSSFLGKVLRETLQHKNTLTPYAFQLLFFADRQEHLANEILPALEQGKIVVCERYCWSCIAYGISSGVQRGILEELTKQCREPDYTFFLNLEEKISMERIEQRGEKKEFFEKTQILKSVKEIMIDLSEQCAFTKRATVLDASESKEQIASRIDMVLTPLLFSQYFEG